MGVDLDQRIGEHIPKWEKRQAKSASVEGGLDGN